MTTQPHAGTISEPTVCPARQTGETLVAVTGLPGRRGRSASQTRVIDDPRSPEVLR